MDLAEAEDIKERWQEPTEEQCKMYLNDQDNHDSVINSPRFIHSGVWSQVSLRKHQYKASGGDETPVEQFQILKHDAVKALH